MFDFDPETLTWFQLDGEPVQIEACNDPEMISKLHDQNIVIGKPSVATSEIMQTYDKENCILGPKAALKYIPNLYIALKEHGLPRKTRKPT